MNRDARADTASHPKISLVTPVWNSGRYIEKTLRSVELQDYPNLEYVVMDGGSTDGTVDIIKRYEKKPITRWVSAPDKGMYDAINKGFATTTGEIMGWISATDMLHTGALKVVASVFQAFPEVMWITGLPTNFDDDGRVTWVSPPPRWSRHRFLAGANNAIQQESTYWRRDLWERAGGHVDASRRNGSDFELWIRFFRHAKLYTVASLIGGYRVHGDALGVTATDEWRETHYAALAREREELWYGALYAPIHAIGRRITNTELGRKVWHGAMMRPLYRFGGPDLAGLIHFKNGRWLLRKF